MAKSYSSLKPYSYNSANSSDPLNGRKLKYENIKPVYSYSTIDMNEYSSFINSAYTYLNRSNNYLTNSGTNSYDNYKGTYNFINADSTARKTKAAELMKKLEYYKSTLNEKQFNSLYNSLSAISVGIDDVKSRAEEMRTQYSKYTSKAAYDLAIQRASSSENVGDMEALATEIEKKEAENDSKTNALKKLGIRVGKGNWVQDLYNYFKPGTSVTDAVIGIDNLANEAYQDRIGELREMRSEYNNGIKLETVTGMETDAFNDLNFEKYVKTGKEKDNKTNIFRTSVGALRNAKPEEGEKNNLRKNNEITDKAAAYSYLSDSEYDMYCYYLGRDEENRKAGTKTDLAQSYLDALEPQLNSRYGQTIYDTDSTLQLAFDAGLSQNAQNSKNGAKMFLGIDKGEYVEPSPIDYADYLMQVDPENGRFVKNAYNLGKNIANQLPSMLIGIAAGELAGAYLPAKAAGKVAKTVGNLSMGLNVAGATYVDMVNNGYGYDEAKRLGVINVYAETMLGEVLSGIPYVGGLLSDEVLGDIASNLSGSLAKFAVLSAGRGISEFTEEFIQECLEPLMKAYVTGETPENIDWGQAFEAGLMGFASSFILGLPTNMNQAISMKYAGNNTNYSDIGPDTTAEGYYRDNEWNTDTGANYEPNENVNGFTPNTEEQNVNVDTQQDITPEQTIFDQDVRGNQSVTPETESLPTYTFEENEQDTAKEISLTIDEALRDQSENSGIDEATLKIMADQYDGSIPADEFMNGMVQGYQYGKNSYPKNGFKSDTDFAKLPDYLKEHAYSLGQNALKSDIETREAEIKANANGNTGHKEGTLSAEGVTMSEIRDMIKDNSQQRIAYNYLSEFSRATGYDIVLYKSEPNEKGKYTDAQGKYDNNKIYIDLNAGLSRTRDLNDLGKYTMLRTFSHETAHLAKDWAPSEYAELKSAINNALVERGQDYDELLADIMERTGLSEGDASDELIGEALTDILPDSKFMYDVSPKLLKRIIDALKGFIQRIKDYFSKLGKNRSAAANALKESDAEGVLHYLNSIVHKYDTMLAKAVDNYQSNYATTEDAGYIDAKDRGNIFQNLRRALKAIEDAGGNTDTFKETYKDITAYNVTEKSASELLNGLIPLINETKSSEAETCFHNIVMLANLVTDDRYDTSKLFQFDNDTGKNTVSPAAEQVTGGTEKVNKAEKTIKDYAKTLSRGHSENTAWYETVTDYDIYKDYINYPIEYVKAMDGYYHLGLFGDTYDYDIDKDTRYDRQFGLAKYKENVDLQPKAAKAAYDAGRDDRSELKVLAMKDGEPIHLQDTKSVLRRVIEHNVFYYGFRNSNNNTNGSETYGDANKTPYNLMDLIDSGNDLYFRFRDMPNNDNERGFYAKVSDYKDTTAQEIIDSVNNAYGAGTLGDIFDTGVKDYYKKYVEGTERKTDKQSKKATNIELGMPILEKTNADGIVWNEDSVVTKKSENYEYKIVDGVVVGNDMYFRFRGTYKTNPVKQFFYAIRNFKDYTANQVLNDIQSRLDRTSTYPLGYHFEEVLRTLYRNNGAEQGFVEPILRDVVSKNTLNTETPSETVETVETSSEPRTTTNEQYGYSITDNIDRGTIEITFSKMPPEEVRNAMKERKFKYSSKFKRWYGKGTHEELSEALNDAYYYADEGSNENVTNEGQNGSGETVRTDNEGTVSEPVSSREGLSRSPESGNAEPVRRTGEEGNAVTSPDREGSGILRTNDSDDRQRNERSGSLGSDQGELQSEPVEQTGERVTLEEEAAQEVEQKSMVSPRGENYTIGDSLNISKNDHDKVQDNIKAIRIVKQLDAENRYATSDEQEALSKYVGWGGLDKAFGRPRYNSSTGEIEHAPDSAYAKDFADLKALVTDGIISQEDYDAARSSTNTAFYTPVSVINAMYNGLESMGFTGGRVLEPSCGVGHFAGLMPSSVKGGIKSMTMVELDPLTGGIAKYLYPNYDVRIQGFEKANIPDNYMDVVIGNVPFGDFPVVDRTYPKHITSKIHNYFIAKALNVTRPGGIVMLITATGTMDNPSGNGIREYFKSKADLVGAIRLPNGTFSQDANTEVGSDILIFKKRAEGTPYGGENFIETPYTSSGAWYSYTINEYFDNNPEMVIGEFNSRGRYGNPIFKLKEGDSLETKLSEAFGKIKATIDYTQAASEQSVQNTVKRARSKNSNGRMEVNADGDIVVNTDGEKTKVNVDEKEAQRLKGQISICETYTNLLDAILAGASETEVNELRKSLNNLYDKFVKKYGFLHDKANRNAFETDPRAFQLLALENDYVQKKGKNPASAKKSDIFTRNTINPVIDVKNVSTVNDGVIASINNKDRIDIAYIAGLTGKTESEVSKELEKENLAFKRKDGTYEEKAKYLSGNVRAKLREAEALSELDSSYNRNVDALKKVIPEKITYEHIDVSLGSTWIPDSVYKDFIDDILESGKSAEVKHENITGTYSVSANWYAVRSANNNNVYGIAKKSFLEIMSDIMNNKTVQVLNREGGIDAEQTSLAQDKAREIKEKFATWVWQDDERRNTLENEYNEIFNALVVPDYDGSNLTVSGLNANYSLYDYQKKAVQRIISSGGNTYLAHTMGAGKTIMMCSAAMKLKQLGVINKPMFVVPKNKVADWASDFQKFYPAAKVLSLASDDVNPASRKETANKIANNDWDAVIIHYQSFAKLPMSEQYLEEYYNEQRNEIVQALAEAKSANGSSDLTTKNLEKKLKSIDAKIAVIREAIKKGQDVDNINFESLGVDAMFVDEAQFYKNLAYTTRLSNIIGLGSQDGNEKTADLITKLRFIQKLNGGRGIVFASGTPVTNSVSELYLLQKYLTPDLLKETGISSFDSWVKQFAEVEDRFEIPPEGVGGRFKNTLSKFKNGNALQHMTRSFMDVLTEIPNLKLPKIKGGAVEVVVCEPSDYQQEAMMTLKDRAERIRSGAKDDWLFSVNDTGKKLTYSQHIINPELPYEENGKILRSCRDTVELYKATEKEKGTQLLFCNYGVPDSSSKDRVPLFQDIKDILIESGIPENEIAFINEGNTDAKMKVLSDKFNAGEIRVMIGTLQRMGTGLNVQTRLCGIKFLSVGDRYSDIDQAIGRGIRNGNTFDEVDIKVYVTQGLFDTRQWDKLKMKKAFVDDLMNGNDISNSDAGDIGDNDLSAAEIMSLAAGDMRLQRQAELTDEVNKLHRLKTAYMNERSRATGEIGKKTNEISLFEKYISNVEADMKNNRSENAEPVIKIDTRTFANVDEGADALFAKIDPLYPKGEKVEVGSVNGYSIVSSTFKKGVWYAVGNHEYEFKSTSTAKGTLKNILAATTSDKMQSLINDFNNKITNDKTDIIKLNEFLKEGFSREQELKDKETELHDITVSLAGEAATKQHEANIGKRTQYQSRALLDDADDDIDADYLALAKNPERNKAALQRMVDAKANEYLNEIFLPDDSDESGFKYHRGAAPTKYIKRYAVMNVSEDGFRAAYAGNKNATPVGVLLDAQNLKSYLSDIVKFDNGEYASYIPGDTGANWKTKFSEELYDSFDVKRSQNWLLERGGKHGTDAPIFQQMNLKQDENGNKVVSAIKDGALPHNKLMFEIEYGMSDEGNLTDYVRENGRMMKGKNQGLKNISPNQFYDFKTNANAVGNWAIGGTFRVLRLVPYEEIVQKTQEYKDNAVNEAKQLYAEKKISKADMNKRVQNANAIQLQRWVGGYHPEDFGLSVEMVDELAARGKKQKLLDPVTYDDNGNVIPLSERFNPDIEDARYQVRDEGALTDREVLDRAADLMPEGELNDVQKEALSRFKKTLNDLEQANNDRIEQGRLYKEQQFGQNVDRSGATATLNRMHTLDQRISRLENELLELENKDVLKMILKRARKVVEENDKAKAKQRLDKYRERMNNNEAIRKYRTRIMTDVEELEQWIMRPDNKKSLKRVPDVLKNPVIAFINSINMTSKRQLSGKAPTKADAEIALTLSKLNTVVNAQNEETGLYSGYMDLPENFKTNLAKMVATANEIMNASPGEHILNLMTADDLKTLSHIIRSLKTYIKQVNAFHENAMFKHVDEASDNSLNTLRKMKSYNPKRLEGLNKYLIWDQIRPAYAWERFGEGGKSIYKEFVAGQAKMAFTSKAILDFAEATYSKDEVRNWEDTVVDTPLGNMPVSYIMGLYELYKQPDSERHILKGGIRTGNFTREKTKYFDESKIPSAADVEETIAILDRYPRAKEVADALQKFMSSYGADLGNYVTMARFGERHFTNPKYYPINSDGRHLISTVDEAPKNASLYALLNMGFTISRKENASNPIILYSIFDVFANHMASMAQYNAFALPILDALKWLNYREVMFSSDGTKTETGNLRAELARVYGAPEEVGRGSGSTGYAETFIKNIIKSYNGTETQGIWSAEPIMNMLRRHNMAQIAYNFRVVAQQPLAITRAGMYLDVASIMEGMQLSPSAIKRNIDDMYAHSGIAVWKSLGFYDINISRGLTDTIKHDQDVRTMINEKGMTLAEKADEVTWAAMWRACRIQTQKDYPRIEVDSDAFYKRVNDLFDEVIYKTQVVDSTLTKSAFMRSKDSASRILSSFQSEGVASISMLTAIYDSYNRDIQNGMSASEAWEKNKPNFKRGFAVWAVGSILLAAVQSIPDALRDDDKDKNFVEKYFSEFLGNVIDELMPFNKLPIISTFYDGLKQIIGIFVDDVYGNDPETVIGQWIEYVVKGTSILKKKISGENDSYTYWAGVYKFIQAGSSISGYPVAAGMREAVTIWNNTIGKIIPRWTIHDYVRGGVENNKFYTKLETGSKKEISMAISDKVSEKKKEIVKSRKENGQKALTDAELDTQARSRVKQSIGSKYSPLYCEARKNGDTAEMERIRQIILNTGLYGTLSDVDKQLDKWYTNKEYED